MKSFIIALVIAVLSVASTEAATPQRRRSLVQHKSMGESRIQSDESYDPYLGMEERRLAGHEMSVSMSMSMEHSDDGEHHSDDGHDHSKDTDSEDEDESESGAMAIGTTVSALAAAGAMLLL